MSLEIDGLPTLKFSQIKVGDVLIREKDHLSRGDSKLYVKRKLTARDDWHGPIMLYCTSSPESDITKSYTGKELSSQNYSIIERDGVRIGTFCVRYW